MFAKKIKQYTKDEIAELQKSHDFAYRCMLISERNNNMLGSMRVELAAMQAYVDAINKSFSYLIRAKND